jgi:hypothetical protein
MWEGAGRLMAVTVFQDKGSVHGGFGFSPPVPRMGVWGDGRGVWWDLSPVSFPDEL